MVFDGPRNKSKKGGEHSTRRFSGNEETTMIDLCVGMGLPFFKAPSEAEAMLTALERSEMVVIRPYPVDCRLTELYLKIPIYFA